MSCHNLGEGGKENGDWLKLVNKINSKKNSESTE